MPSSPQQPSHHTPVCPGLTLCLPLSMDASTHHTIITRILKLIVKSSMGRACCWGADSQFKALSLTPAEAEADHTCVLRRAMFSTGVLRNLGVLSMASKGSAESNRIKKWHLRPLDTFAWLLVCQKCICGPEHCWRSLQRSHRPLAHCPIPRTSSPPTAFEPRISRFPPIQTNV